MFEGKYRILELVGSGGFAQVFRAEFEEVGRQVAIKILVPDPELGDALYPTEIDQRFLREAKMLSELRDPHTVIMHDFGRAVSGLLYMVFEFIDGTPLNRLIKDRGPQPGLLVRRILEQVLQSLREAHSKGILHRDIKPANIMLYEFMGDPSHIKLLDFGIAKPLGGEDDYEVTQAGVMMGTPRYMSPEQICGQRMSPAADIYSLGLVAYELLVGRPAIDATTSPTIVRIQLGPREFELPSMPGCPPELKRIVDRMTQKELTRRYQTVDQVITDLKALGSINPAQAASVITEGPALSIPSATVDPQTSRNSSQTSFSARPGHGSQSSTSTPGQSGFNQHQRFGLTGQTQQGHVDPQLANQATQRLGGSHGPAHALGTVDPSQPSVVAKRPLNTSIELSRQGPNLTVEIPMRITKHALVLLGGSAALLSVIVLTGVWILFPLPVIAGLFAVAYATQTAQLDVDLDASGWRITRTFLGYGFERNGPLSDVVCLREENRDGKSILRLVSAERAVTLASDLKPGENAWLVSEVNGFISSGGN